MSEESLSKKRRLDFSGVLLTAFLGIAMFVLNLLLTASFAFYLSYQNAADTQRILKGLKVDGVDVSSAFTFDSKAFEMLATWQSVVIILVAILILLALWCLYYRFSSYYASKAIGIYSRITLFMGIVMIVAALFSEPVISYYFEDFAKNNSVKLRSFCAVVVISCLVLMIWGIITSITSLLISGAEGAPRKRLIDDELFEGSIQASEIIKRKKDKEKSDRASEKRKKQRAISMNEITPHTDDMPPEQSERRCENCGALIKHNALYCGQCGKKV